MPGVRHRHCGVRCFLVPCLLLLLQRGPGHGYTLLNELKEFGFDPSLFDPSRLYRTLHEMEAAELVTSKWVDESHGPQKRDYAITPKGIDQLQYWIGDLQRTRDEIDRLLAACENSLKS